MVGWILGCGMGSGCGVVDIGEVGNVGGIRWKGFFYSRLLLRWGLLFFVFICFLYVILRSIFNNEFCLVVLFIWWV